jgi:excisionase family DNA binding protein
LSSKWDAIFAMLRANSPAEYVMATSRPEVTGRRSADNDLEPLAVSPKQACRLLAIGNTRLYELIATGELATYLDGRSRRIVLQSIRERIARLLAGEGATGTLPPPRRRGRPPKQPATEARS